MTTAKQILLASADGTPEWKAQRTKGIGGSDMASLYNGYGSPRAVYEAKLGLSAPEEIDARTQAIFDYGHEREPHIRKAAAEHFGVRFRNTGTWQNVENPWMLANPDGLAGSDSLLEIKTTGGFTDAAKEWKAGRVPTHAWVQAHWYALVTGRTRLYFAAEVDRQQVFLGPYDADPALMQKLREQATEIWAAVKLETPPEVTYVEPEAPAFVAPADGSEKVLDPTAPAFLAWRKLTEKKAEVKRLTAEVKDLETVIKDEMGDVETLRDTDGNALVTWKAKATKRLDEKALAAAGVNVAEFKKETFSRTFLVKEIAA